MSEKNPPQIASAPKQPLGRRRFLALSAGATTAAAVGGAAVLSLALSSKAFAATGWQVIAGSGSLSRISVGSVTHVWGVNSAGNVFGYTGNDNSPWLQFPGSLSDIAVGADGTAWGVNSDGAVFRQV